MDNASTISKKTILHLIPVTPVPAPKFEYYMSELQDYKPSPFGTVNTIHILKSGEIVSSLAEYEKVEQRFSWVNKRYILLKLLHLRNLTDNNKKSVIAIYEDGQHIKEFINVDPAFRPLAFC